MSKYPCGLIEDVLPLYVEGDVSDETKEIVEKHLKECKECRALAQEYSSDELKLYELKEDLPQAKTYKNWMKKLKRWSLVITSIIMLVAISIGIIGYKIGEESKDDILKLKTIVKTLEKQGVNLDEDKSKSPGDYDLGGVKPTIYDLGDEKGTLLIYVFKSIGQRQDIVNKFNGQQQDIVNKSDKFDYKLSTLGPLIDAKNALIVCLVDENITFEEYEPIGETMSLVSDVVFKDLNDGKVIVYKGESESWEGTFTIKYYEHYGKEESGNIRYDSYKWTYPEIKYKNSDIASVGPIEFEYKINAGESGSVTGAELKEDGSVLLGSSGGTGTIPKNDEEINFIIKWNGKEESIKLKPQ